jgi:hypothetical protein
MFAECHFGVLAELLHRQGMGMYAEAAGVSLEILEETLLNKGKVDIPMGEFWMRALHPEPMYYVDVRGAASAAHAYDKPLVAAESFTGGGYEAPYSLKKVGDYWFTQGVNRIVFHTSAHQPLDGKPGNVMVGTHINRNITWAEQAAPLMTYLARTSFMLQQGIFVADLAYLLPEGAPSTMPFWGAGLQPAPPVGHDFDCINTDVLLNRLSVGEDGRLSLPGGMSYRLLVLPQNQQMGLSVLRKIRERVAGGATVVGPKPVKTPGLAGLAGYPVADRELYSMAAELWGDVDGISVTRHASGRGRLYWGLPLSDVLASQHVPRNFETSRSLDSEVSWIHRKAGDADIYFVVNRTDRSQELEARFRVSGKSAELWHPDSSLIEQADYSVEDGRTVVPLHMAGRESLFVVFRGRAAAASRWLPRATATTIGAVSGPWEVRFPPSIWAPERTYQQQLESWTSSTDFVIKYFSGTVKYSKSLDAPESWFRPGVKILLDFGSVKDIIEVTINGGDLGIFWKPPYQADVSDLIKPGTNQLTLRVTNQWTNQQMGWQVPPQKQAPSQSGVAAGSPARGPQTPPESGLIGPVSVISVDTAATAVRPHPRK